MLQALSETYATPKGLHALEVTEFKGEVAQAY